MYKIDDIIEADGMKRRVTGFCFVSGAEYPVTEPHKEDPESELKCRYCGKAYKDPTWLASHEEKCTENPANKDGDQ